MVLRNDFHYRLKRTWSTVSRNLKSSISSCWWSTAQTENCYYTDWRVWLKQSSVSHMKHHMKFTNEWVLITIVEVLDCGERRTVCCSKYMVFLFDSFLGLWLLQFLSMSSKFSCWSHFGASPVITACYSGKFFAFLLGFSTWMHYNSLRPRCKGQSCPPHNSTKIELTTAQFVKGLRASNKWLGRSWTGLI